MMPRSRCSIRKVWTHFAGSLAGKTIAVWGLAYKPRTDDIREAPALARIDSQLKAGAKVRVHDPEAMANVRELFGDKIYYSDRLAYGERSKAARRACDQPDRVAGVPQSGL